MNDELKTNIKTLLGIIRTGKDFTKAKDFNSLFLEAENIISWQAYLIGPMFDIEHRYRLIVSGLVEAGESNAKADTLAKARQEYVDWQKIRAVYELGTEQLLLIKKFSDKLEMEQRNTNPPRSRSPFTN